MRALRGLKKKSLGSNDIVSLDTTTHCIHPDFLQHQIKKSLKRLNRKWLDGFLIHNPEYYLKSKLTEVKKEVYYRRIKQSFELLEELA
jgi:aryl-alcohol dehydrogenase-like predicted oxidoreductase